MTRETAIGSASIFFIFGLIIGSVELILGTSLNETVYACLGIALFFYIISYFLKPMKTEWICQKCNTTLIRKQIKFGLCPVCGIKVKDFRGLTYRSTIYDF